MPLSLCFSWSRLPSSFQLLKLSRRCIAFYPGKTRTPSFLKTRLLTMVSSYLMKCPDCAFSHHLPLARYCLGQYDVDPMSSIRILDISRARSQPFTCEASRRLVCTWTISFQIPSNDETPRVLLCSALPALIIALVLHPYSQHILSLVSTLIKNAIRGHHKSQCGEPAYSTWSVRSHKFEVLVLLSIRKSNISCHENEEINGPHLWNSF